MAPRAERKPYTRNETRNPDEVLSLHLGARTFKTVQTDQEDDPENPMVGIAIQRPIGMMELTVMTGLEIRALRGWFNESLDIAEAIVDRLDLAAAAAHANGDTSYKRLWRQDPVYIQTPKGE